ncbi:BKACE family enzyme [Aerophototrophica crusticola]
MSKVILTAALNGVLTDPARFNVPVTPEEMARAARGARDAGASIVHIHYRAQKPGRGHLPSWDPAVAAAITEAIRAEVPDIIVNSTTGTIGPDIAGPLDCLRAVRPEIAAANAGTLNYLKATSEGQWAWPPMVFDNPVEKLQAYLDAMAEIGAVPEFECFDIGIVRSVSLYQQVGMVRRPPQVNFVMGVASGMPADPDLLPILLKYLPAGASWQTTVIGRAEVWAVHRRAAELGGHLRTGLEDTFYLPDGSRADGNARLIEQLASLAREAGREVASPAETRAILSL